MELPREEEEEERKGQPGSLPITHGRAEGPKREGAVGSEDTEVMSTAELAKEPGKAQPTLHHLPDREQAQRSNSHLSSPSSALNPLVPPLAVPFWALLVVREVIYNGWGEAVPRPSPSQGTSVLHVACSGAVTPHLLQRVTAQCWANVGPALGLTPSARGVRACRDCTKGVLHPGFRCISTNFLQQHQSCWARVTAALCPPSLCPSGSTSWASSCSANCLCLQILTLKTVGQAEGRRSTLEVEELGVI